MAKSTGKHKRFSLDIYAETLSCHLTMTWLKEAKHEQATGLVSDIDRFVAKRCITIRFQFSITLEEEMNVDEE